MNFTIPVEVYWRLSHVTKRSEPSLKFIRLERSNGHVFAVATNRRIASIEYLGRSVGDDGAIHLVVDNELINQCKMEMGFGSSLSVICIPALNMITVGSSLGYNYAGNAGEFPSVNCDLANWREWADSETLTESTGAMQWTSDSMCELMAASPSGWVVFPQFIDRHRPITLRDPDAPNWVGLFIPCTQSEDGEKNNHIDPAELPNWWTL